MYSSTLATLNISLSTGFILAFPGLLWSWTSPPGSEDLHGGCLESSHAEPTELAHSRRLDHAVNHQAEYVFQDALDTSGRRRISLPQVVRLDVPHLVLDPTTRPGLEVGLPEYMFHTAWVCWSLGGCS